MECCNPGGDNFYNSISICNFMSVMKKWLKWCVCFKGSIKNVGKNHSDRESRARNTHRGISLPKAASVLGPDLGEC